MLIINTKAQSSCHKICWKQPIQIPTKFLASVWIEKQDLLSGVFLHRLRRQAPAPQTPPSLPLACLSPSLLFPTVPGRMSVTSLLDIEAFVIRGPCQIWSSQIAMNALNKPSHFIISCYLDLPMLNWTAYLFKSKKNIQSCQDGIAVQYSCAQSSFARICETQEILPKDMVRRKLVGLRQEAVVWG